MWSVNDGAFGNLWEPFAAGFRNICFINRFPVIDIPHGATLKFYYFSEKLETKVCDWLAYPDYSTNQTLSNFVLTNNLYHINAIHHCFYLAVLKKKSQKKNHIKKEKYSPEPARLDKNLLLHCHRTCHANLFFYFLFLEKLETKVCDWLAYPDYSTNQTLSNFVLTNDLYHINAIEWSASAMEMSVIGAKNVANMIIEKYGISNEKNSYIHSRSEL